MTCSSDSVTACFLSSGEKKKEVSLLTTVHTGKMKDTGKRDHETKEKIMKPDVLLLDYEKHFVPCVMHTGKLKDRVCQEDTQVVEGSILTSTCLTCAF